MLLHDRRMNLIPQEHPRFREYRLYSKFAIESIRSYKNKWVGKEIFQNLFWKYFPGIFLCADARAGPG